MTSILYTYIEAGLITGYEADLIRDKLACDPTCGSINDAIRYVLASHKPMQLRYHVISNGICWEYDREHDARQRLKDVLSRHGIGYLIQGAKLEPNNDE